MSTLCRVAWRELRYTVFGLNRDSSFALESIKAKKKKHHSKFSHCRGRWRKIRGGCTVCAHGADGDGGVCQCRRHFELDGSFHSRRAQQGSANMLWSFCLHSGSTLKTWGASVLARRRLKNLNKLPRGGEYGLRHALCSSFGQNNSSFGHRWKENATDGS